MGIQQANKMAAYIKSLNSLLFFSNRSCIFLRASQAATTPLTHTQNEIQQTRGKKHWHPAFKKERAAKILKVDLPTFVELKKDKKTTDEARTPDEIRMEMKKDGRLPPISSSVLPINISCTRGIIDEYKPEAGDGRHTDIMSSGLSDYTGKTKGSVKTMKDKRKLQKYEDFNDKEFAETAQKIVIEANTLLQDIYKNQERLHELVTEEAFPKMVHGLESKTMRWKFVESVEPPKVMQIRTDEMITSENMFSQITVRLHTRQILAIYDRFGRLMFGDPYIAKAVVEYVVLEKWISDTYGLWRIHGKITPPDAPARNTLIKTYKVPVFDPLPPPNTEETADAAAAS